MSFFEELLSGMSIISSIFEGQPGAQKMRETLICPHCEEQQTLKVKEKSGVKIYLCYFCGGCFMTTQCLNNFISYHNESDWPELFDLEADSGHTYGSSPAARPCPGCGVRMDNIQYKYQSGIWVDYCPQGHGIWLDSGEIKLLKDYSSGSASSWPSESGTPEEEPSPYAEDDLRQDYSTYKLPSPESLQAKPAEPVQPVQEVDYRKDQPVSRPSLKDETISTGSQTGIEMKLRQLKEEEMLLQKKRREEQMIMGNLSPEKMEEYRAMALNEWDRDCRSWGTSFPMTEGYLKNKIKQYTKQGL